MDKEKGRLQGRVTLITGAAQGIGRGIADAMAAEGAIVGVLDRREKLAELAVEAIRAGGGEAHAFGGDVARRETFTNAIDALLQKYGRLNVLVNNASWVRYGSVDSITQETLDRMLGTGFSSVVWGIQTAADAMRENGGSIINIASVAAFVGLPEAAVYCGVKAGVLGLTRSTATDLGPLAIRVNAIAPGAIPTEGVKINVDTDKATRRIERTPLRRLGTVQDIAKAACFLASDDSAFITGEVLSVDGGITHAFL